MEGGLGSKVDKRAVEAGDPGHAGKDAKGEELGEDGPLLLVEVKGAHVLQGRRNGNEKLAGTDHGRGLVGLGNQEDDTGRVGVTVNAEDGGAQEDAGAQLLQGLVVEAPGVASAGEDVLSFKDAAQKARSEALEAVQGRDGREVARIPVQLGDNGKQGREAVLVCELAEGKVQLLGNGVRDKKALVDPSVLAQDILGVSLRGGFNSLLLGNGVCGICGWDARTQGEVVQLY